MTEKYSMTDMYLSRSGSHVNRVALNYALGRWMRFGEEGLEFGIPPNMPPVITFGVDEV
jgi:hypothetical protein